MVAKGDTIYAGCQDGYVKVVDLETKTLIRTIIVEEVGAYSFVPRIHRPEYVSRESIYSRSHCWTRICSLVPPMVR